MLNERFHRYLHKIIHQLSLQTDYGSGYDHKLLLADLEIGRNCAHQSNNEMFRFTSSLLLCLALSMNLNYLHVFRGVLHIFISRTKIEIHFAPETSLRVLWGPIGTQHPNGILWNPWKGMVSPWRQGWCCGLVANLNNHTIMIAFDCNLFPTHESRVSPYFAKLLISSHLDKNRWLLSRPDINNESFTHLRALISAWL